MNVARRSLVERATPPLPAACPAQWPAPWRWGQPLPPELERSRSIGARRVVARPGGVPVTARVVGSTAPAQPSLSDLVRSGQSLCARGVLLELKSGGRVALQSQRLRELNRAPRPLEPGLSMPPSEAAALVARARARLAAGDVRGSDAERAGTLPYTHRAGSSPCSGARRPAAVLEAVEAWREGEGYDNATEADMVALARAAMPRARIRSLADVQRAAAAQEGECLDAWETWVERNAVGRVAQIKSVAGEVRAQYAPRKKSRAK